LVRPPWRRTVDGWEPRSNWNHRPMAHQPSLHPAVVTGLLLLASTLAAIGFQPRRAKVAPPASSKHDPRGLEDRSLDARAAVIPAGTVPNLGHATETNAGAAGHRRFKRHQAGHAGRPGNLCHGLQH